MFRVFPGRSAAPAQPASQGLGLLRATPDNGAVGSSFTLSGEGLPRNKSVDIVWATARARTCSTRPSTTSNSSAVKIEPVNVVLAKRTTDAAGRLESQLKVPRDYGSIHDIYAVADGRQVGQGRVPGQSRLHGHPEEGSDRDAYHDQRDRPRLEVVREHGRADLGQQVRRLHLEHDDARCRDRPDPGRRACRRAHDGDGERGERAALPRHRAGGALLRRQVQTAFTVTGDKGPPKPTMEWPEAVQPTVSTRTTLLGVASGVKANLSSQIGDVLTKVDVTASGLAPGVPVDLKWATPVGTRSLASGWSMASDPARAGDSGRRRVVADLDRDPEQRRRLAHRPALSER